MSELDPVKLARMVREHLQKSSSTQSQFARRAGVSPATITRLLQEGARRLNEANQRKILAAIPAEYRKRPELTVPRATSDNGTRIRRVFLSSTYLDLAGRRDLVMKAVESFDDLKCVAMERFTASTRPAVEECLRAVRSSELYVGILGYRYGWIPDGEEKSITELEHDAALEAGIQRLVFVVDPRECPVNIEVDMDPGEDRWDKAKLLDAFKRRLGSTRISPRPFATSDQLVHFVHVAMREWSADRPEPPVAEERHRELEAYRAALLAEHGRLPMVGFPTNVRVPMGLQELFVPLLARPRRGALEDEPGADRKTEPRWDEELPFAVEESSEQEGKSVPTVFARAGRLGRRLVVVLGDPGAGKTTQLQRLAYASLARNAHELLGLDGAREPALVPVLVRLRHVTGDLLNEGLGALIHHALPAHARLDRGFCDWLAAERGRLLVLFDGLDEVPGDLRDETAERVREIVKDHASSWFVLSSRPPGYSAAARDRLEPLALEVEIQKLRDEDIDAFVRRWYAIVEREGHPVGWEARAEAAASDLLERLKAQQRRASIRVWEMTSNPLLLTVICLIHKDRGSHLPEDRQRLYREAAEVLLERWRLGKGLDVELPADAARTVLEPVAYFLHDVEERTSATASELANVLREPLREAGWKGTPESFLLHLRDDSGILCGESNDRYRFLHLGLQEYCCARAIHSRFAELAYEHREEADELLDRLLDRFGASWWEEVFQLLFSIPDKPFLFAPFFGRLAEKRPELLARERQAIEDCMKEGLGVSPRPFASFLDRELPIVPRVRADEIAAAVNMLQGCGEPGLAALLDRTRARKLVRHAPLPIARLVTELASKRSEPIEAELKAVLDGRGRAVPKSARGGSPSVISTRLHAPSDVMLVRVPGGSFRMGGRRFHAEQPVHSVRVPTFWLAETPVTNAQYRAFVEATTHPAPPSWKDRRLNADEQPVVTVSWDDAQAFCRWAGLRLPSEAEWEYACRGGTTTEFWFGDEEERLADYGWFVGNSEGELQRVARKPANPFGLHDMHGNVWEWCQDRWHENYDGAPQDGSAWEEGGSEGRVFRGGSFGASAWFARSAYRDHWPPVNRDVVLGFRPSGSDH